MSKPARVNLNKVNSDAVRKIQSEYFKKNQPAKLSVEAITDIAVEYGTPLARKRFNLD
jgi:hypothetical protein